GAKVTTPPVQHDMTCHVCADKFWTFVQHSSPKETSWRRVQVREGRRRCMAQGRYATVRVHPLGPQDALQEVRAPTPLSTHSRYLFTLMIHCSVCVVCCCGEQATPPCGGAVWKCGSE